MPITIGTRIRDTVTGFTGMATVSLYEYEEPVRIFVNPQTHGEGSTEGGQWFTETRLEPIEEGENPQQEQPIHVEV